nr:protein ALP1-like [Tanacetum cinerariifolium]
MMTDVVKLYQHHEEKHGFLRKLGSLDCIDYEWFGCLYRHKGQYVRRDHGLNPFILVEVVASQHLWIWHALLGISESNNDINALHQSFLFNDLKSERAPKIQFVANGVTFPWGYYLVDGMYLELATFVKTILKPSDDDHKRIRYKKMQESERKDVKRVFGVLKKKWDMLVNPYISLIHQASTLHLTHLFIDFSLDPRGFIHVDEELFSSNLYGKKIVSLVICQKLTRKILKFTESKTYPASNTLS